MFKEGDLVYVKHIGIGKIISLTSITPDTTWYTVETNEYKVPITISRVLLSELSELPEEIKLKYL